MLFFGAVRCDAFIVRIIYRIQGNQSFRQLRHWAVLRSTHASWTYGRKEKFDLDWINKLIVESSFAILCFALRSSEV